MRKPPNILLVMTDQQHFRALGCNGAPEARTPHIDQLAAGGINFKNHFATNPVCSPSRGSIMTGKYITEHGLWRNGCRLPETNDTIPKAMGRAGFQTAHFGKMHLVPIINRTTPHPAYGFDVAEVAEGDQQLLDDAYFRWLRTTDPNLFVRYVNEMFTQGHFKAYKSLMPEEQHQTSWVTRRSIDWLKNHRDRSRPFLLSVGYFDPHHAFNPCEPYASMYEEAPVSEPVFHEESLAMRPAHYKSGYENCKGVTEDKEKLTAIIRAYHAMMAHVDKCVGDLVRTLGEEGLAEETVVLFTSDHGEMLGNHGFLWKGPYLLDDLLRVPLIVSVPGRPAAPRVVEDLTSMVDVMATLQSLAGVENIARESGRPFLSRDLELFPEGKRDHVLAEWEHSDNSPSASQRMIRTSDYKLVYYANSTEGELYDLRADPNEFFNRYADPQYASVRADLEKRLAQHYLSRRPQVRYEGGW
jgi:arylsulfatase